MNRNKELLDLLVAYGRYRAECHMAHQEEKTLAQWLYGDNVTAEQKMNLRDIIELEFYKKI